MSSTPVVYVATGNPQLEDPADTVARAFTEVLDRLGYTVEWAAWTTGFGHVRVQVAVGPKPDPAEVSDPDGTVRG